MSSLFATLSSSANTLDAIQQSLNVTQNNVSNASTPGYAAQVAVQTPALFDPLGGLSGGVVFTGTQSLRDENSERFLQQQNSALGSATAISGTLTPLDSALSVSTTSGVPAALTSFSSSFAALSQDPGSESAKQQVLTSAQNVASAFQTAANAVSQAGDSADQQITSVIDQINTLAGQISGINKQQAASPTPDPNLDATLHSDLDTLSGLVNFTSSFAGNGAVTILVGGQTTLVSNTTAYPISTGLTAVSPTASEPGGVPSRAILDDQGNDITSQISGGQLGGLLQVRNTTLAAIRGDTNQPGSLNTLAKGFADQVNTILEGGQISAGPPAVPGVAIFQYAAGGDTGAAQSLSVTSVTADQIATIDPGPPSVANGIATRLGDFANSSNPADQINGSSVTTFYGQIAADFGNQLSDANTNQTQQTQAVAQAQNLVSQASGVSLDQEAVQLIQFQNAYQAVSKMVNVIDELTQTTINLIPPTT
jgi:flagellar hook-associated protein 1